MIHLYTGNGKGKTTAALGSALRAVGERKKVLMVQFIKGPWKSGEDEAYKKLAPDFLLVKMGKGFVGILGDTLPRGEHEKAAEAALVFARAEAEAQKWDIIILDEVNNAIQLGLIKKEKVLEFVQYAKEKVEHLILTGRDAPEELIDLADLVTEMKDVKHPYYEGKKGKRGLEY